MDIVEVKIPDFGESIQEVSLAKWVVEDNSYVKEGDSICELESDKASMELPAETSGKIEIKAQEDCDYKIGDVIATIDTSAHPAETTDKNAEQKPLPEDDQAQSSGTSESLEQPGPQESPIVVERTSDENANNHAAGHPSPSARKILTEKGISVESVVGSGKDGRITKTDALLAEKKESSSSDSTSGRVVTEQKMSRLRKTISKRLVEAKNTTAMLTTFNEVDMTEIMRLRKVYKEDFKQKHGVSLGFMSFFTRACCIALSEYPIVGAIIDQENILFHDFSDVGIAVSTPKGLVVPVLRNAESMSLSDIEKEIRHLAAKARDGKLSIDDMRGGNFTITNGGTFGSMLSTPIINIPQSAILGMHNIVERPHVVDGEIKIRPIMYLALSYDHRIIDGKDSVSFLVKVKEILENPAKQILENDLLDL